MREGRAGAIAPRLASTLAALGAFLDALGGLLLALPRFAVYLLRRRHWRSLLESALAAPRPALAPPLRHPPRPKPRPPTTIYQSRGPQSAQGPPGRLHPETHPPRTNHRWIGFGGERLRAAGCDVRFDLVGLGLIGFTVVFWAIPRLLRVVATFDRILRKEKPALVVLLDYPGLHLILARLARRRGVPVLYYIAPQVWGWAPWRVRRMRRDLARVLCILPFEAPWFQKNGVPATHVGHPLADALEKVPRSRAPDPDLLVLLPGSRRKEIRANLPSQVRIFERLRAQHPKLHAIVAHTRADLGPFLKELAGPGIEVSARDFHGPLSRARLVLAKSGTGILEVAHHAIPLLVLYRVRRPLASLARFFLCTPWFASINLIANREVVPEFCFDGDGSEAAIAERAAALLAEGSEREGSKRDLEAVREAFDAPGTAARAATALLEALRHP